MFILAFFQVCAFGSGLTAFPMEKRWVMGLSSEYPNDEGHEECGCADSA
jgi:hypothetical protein